MTKKSQCIRVVTSVCNNFRIDDEVGLARGIQAEMSHFGNHLLMSDKPAGIEGEVNLFGVSGHKDIPDISFHGLIMSARPSRIPDPEGHRSLGARNNYSGCIIFVSGQRSVPMGKKIAAPLIPGAIVMRSSGLLKDGYIRAGASESWEKEQLCILEPGDYMYVVDGQMRVVVITMHKKRIIMRQPTDIEVVELLQETTKIPKGGF